MSIIGTRPPLISETNLYVCWGLTPLRKRSTQIFRNLSLRLICILPQIANTPIHVLFSFELITEKV